MFLQVQISGKVYDLPVYLDHELLVYKIDPIPSTTSIMIGEL